MRHFSEIYTLWVNFLRKIAKVILSAKYGSVMYARKLVRILPILGGPRLFIGTEVPFYKINFRHESVIRFL